MKSALDDAARRELGDRILRLRFDRTPSWGRMDAARMVVHLSDSLRMAFGELIVAPRRLPLRFTPLKQLCVYWVPIPKGAPTAPELIARQPGDWDSTVSELQALLDRLAETTAATRWPAHPAFGKLTGKQWGVLIYRHMDHHLRQFGV